MTKSWNAAPLSVPVQADAGRGWLIMGPGAGACVSGGAVRRDVPPIGQTAGDAGPASAVALAEPNPFVDEFGQTANVPAGPIASRSGHEVIDRAA